MLLLVSLRTNRLLFARIMREEGFADAATSILEHNRLLYIFRGKSCSQDAPELLVSAEIQM